LNTLGTGGWPTVQAIQDVARQVGDSGDPALIDALLATLRFKIDSEGEAAKTADTRLAPIIRLASADLPLARQAIRHVAAEISGDARRHATAALERVAAIAATHGLPVPRATPSPDDADQSDKIARSGTPIRTRFELARARTPAFASNPSFIDLLAGLRAADTVKGSGAFGAWDEVVLALSYHVGGLIDVGRADDACRLLRFFARDIHIMPGPEHPLAKLALALENAGYADIAAFTYALAFSATRGGGGFLTLGGRKYAHLMAKGIALAGNISRQVVADEVAYALRGSWYSVGTSRHLIEQLAVWDDPIVAEAAWRQAFAVIAHRLPLVPQGGWFAPLELDGKPSWTVDESLVALLLARLSHPHLARKIAALAGVVRAIQRRPDTVPAPLLWWLTQNAHVTSVLLVLDPLLTAEPQPFTITPAIQGLLSGYAACSLWGVRRLASNSRRKK